MNNKLSVTEYCSKFQITRNAVHRRIKKFENKKININNIINVERIGTKIIVLTINPKIKFKKR